MNAMTDFPSSLNAEEQEEEALHRKFSTDQVFKLKMKININLCVKHF